LTFRRRIDAAGAIAYVNLPLVPDSRTQGGRRPAGLVLADIAAKGNPMTMIVPLTTNLSAKRFPFTLEISPSSVNGLSSPSVAMVFQLRAIDTPHVEKVIGTLESLYLAQIDAMMQQILGL
jgi:mRNA interferase MazF